MSVLTATAPTVAELLDFEARNPGEGDAKVAVIFRELGLTAARYYQLLNRALDTSEAIAHDPILTRQLARLRDERTKARLARTFRV